MPSLFDAFKQYINDAKPGGLLNPEVPPGGPTELAKGLLSFTPVVGDAISGYDAYQSAKQGNYGEAALNGLGLLPFVPAFGGLIGKGEKALPYSPDMLEKAKKLGFDIPAFHATDKVFDVFDPEKSSKAVAFGKGSYFESSPKAVSGWSKSTDGANVMPVMLNSKNLLPMQPLSKANAEKLSKYLGREIKEGDPVPYFSLERRGGSVSEGAKAAGFDVVEHAGPGGHGTNYVVTNPSAIRGRFDVFE